MLTHLTRQRQQFQGHFECDVFDTHPLEQTRIFRLLAFIRQAKLNIRAEASTFDKNGFVGVGANAERLVTCFSLFQQLQR